MLAKRKRRKPKAGEVITHIEHFLVPKHELVKDDEIEKLLEKLEVTREQLPRIRQYDPAIADLNAKEGDIIKIHRIDEAVYYSIVTKY
jgi:DNA-directed RNA polymerase subunit H (RpoH/RPB5)